MLNKQSVKLVLVALMVSSTSFMALAQLTPGPSNPKPPPSNPSPSPRPPPYEPPSPPPYNPPPSPRPPPYVPPSPPPYNPPSPPPYYPPPSPPPYYPPPSPPPYYPPPSPPPYYPPPAPEPPPYYPPPAPEPPPYYPPPAPEPPPYYPPPSPPPYYPPDPPYYPPTPDPSEDVIRTVVVNMALKNKILDLAKWGLVNSNYEGWEVIAISGNLQPNSPAKTVVQLIADGVVVASQTNPGKKLRLTPNREIVWGNVKTLRLKVVGSTQIKNLSIRLR